MKKLIVILIIILAALGAYYIFSLKEKPGLNIPEIKVLSCEKLHEKILTEANKLDRSCANDNDCLEIGGHACGDCINKNANTAEYFSDIKKLRVMEVEAFKKKEGCNIPAYSCAQPKGCRCVNSKCESII